MDHSASVAFGADVEDPLMVAYASLRFLPLVTSPAIFSTLSCINLELAES